MSSLAALTPEQRTKLLRMRSNLSDEAQAQLRFSWEMWARPEQLPPPGDWRIWLILAGRGWGKTRTLCEWCRSMIENGRSRGGLIARTSADARDVLVEGESGLLAVCPPWNRPTYEPSKRRLTWPNGAMITFYSADQPDQLRGPQHDFCAMDELAAWASRDPFDQAMFGLRLGPDPKTVIATTPRPTPLIKELLARDDVHKTRGATWDNASNLPPSTLAALRERYGGTRLGAQELEGQVLTDVPGALWRLEMIEAARIAAVDRSQLQRIVVGVDPAVTAHEGSDETGIIVCGVDKGGTLYVLEDCSLRASPEQWARRAIECYRRWGADRIVGESNQGGDLIESVLRAVDRNVSYSAVRATRGKYLRAEPIAALYEQGRAKHVGKFPALEEQMLSFAPGDPASPDRLDALVWAATNLCVRDVPLQIFL